MLTVNRLVRIKKNNHDIEKFNIEKLSGLMFKTKKFDKASQNVLLIGGWQNFDYVVNRIAKVIAHKFNISVASMPGEDGTSSLKKIGLQPSLEKYAGYYYSFIKLTYLNQPVKIVCFDISLPIVLAMFEHHPEVKKQVIEVVVINPYTGYAQLNLSRSELKITYLLCWLGGKLPIPFPRLIFWLLRSTKLNNLVGFGKVNRHTKLSTRLYLAGDLLSVDLSTYTLPSAMTVILQSGQTANLPSNFKNAKIITMPDKFQNVELVNKILQIL